MCRLENMPASFRVLAGTASRCMGTTVEGCTLLDAVEFEQGVRHVIHRVFFLPAVRIGALQV